ncbi:MAG: hypothetical protein R2748_03255 [Bryobacterales bacterium]
MIVAAAGNAGAFGEQQFPTRNTISTPGTAPGVITVSATVNARQLQQSVEIPGTRFARLARGQARTRKDDPGAGC